MTQGLWHKVLWMWIWIGVCLKAEAATYAEAGATTSAPALPVYSAQPFDTDGTALPPDTLTTPDEPDTLLAADAHADTLRLGQVADSLMKRKGRASVPKKQFVPNPQRALWLSLVFPGAGQIYNRKYWKLPFVYGGFLGCAYALMWNQMMYRDYSQAYLDIMDDDPNTHSYLDMLPPRYDISGREEQFKNVFKRKKDFYRRYRDLSAFCFVGVYLLSVIDAYVDAHLSEFDITPDLSMRIAPAVMPTQGTGSVKPHNAYGLGCSLHF